MNKFLIIILLLINASTGIVSAEQRLRLATTTSTDNSGLLAVLHPPFEARHNVNIDVIAVGTGKALRLGQNGDVDLVMVHAPKAEKKFVADGYGVERLSVMHNDFVIIGPVDDPAGAKRARNAVDALTRIKASNQVFVSRGDDSGTHKKEMSLWNRSEIAPDGNWYLAVGQGMGAVIKIADDKLAYTLSDRGTYLAFKENIELEIVFSGDVELSNPYHVILVNQQKHPHVKSQLARKYVDFIRGEEGQRIIREFRKAGEQLFVPDVIP